MKVLVCGSRDWPTFDPIWQRLKRIALETPVAQCPVTVIQGGSRGADQFAETAAARIGFRVETFPADWRGKGKRAGIIRNLAMLDAEPDLVIAFQRNGSRGTQHTIDEARKRGIPVEVHSSG